MNADKKIGNKIYEILTNLRVVKYSTIIAFITFITCTTLGYIVAQFDPPGPGLDPVGYNIIDSYLSDMGSIDHTPWPYFPVIGNIISSFLLIPTVLYMHSLLAPVSKRAQNVSKPRIIIGIIGAIWMLIGLVGRLGLGIFTEDVSMRIHWYCTVLEFAGLTFGGIFFGIIITYYDTLLPKFLGVYMIFVPTTLAIIAFGQGLQPLEEWILTFSIIAYLFIGGIIVLKHINNELASK